MYLHKSLRKDRVPNSSPARLPRVRSVAVGKFLKVFKSAAANGEGHLGQGWLSRAELERHVGHGSLDGHTLFYALQHLMNRGLVERQNFQINVNGTHVPRVHFRTTQLGNGNNERWNEHVHEQEMHTIVTYFNDPLRAGRVNITKQEVAIACGRTNTTSKIFRASFRELLRRGDIRANPNRYGHYQL